MEKSTQPAPPATPRSAGNDGSSEQSEASERVRAAVQRNPRRMTMQLARELGVPEVEVVRALPDDRAVELDVSQWEAVLRSLEALGPLRVLVSNGAATVEVVGQFG